MLAAAAPHGQEVHPSLEAMAAAAQADAVEGPAPAQQVHTQCMLVL